MDTDKPNPRESDSNYILNPQTKRYVSRVGQTGRRILRQMSRAETEERITRHTIDESLKHRNLLSSNLSDKELLDILRKVVNLKLNDDQIVSMTEPKTKTRKKVKIAPKPKKKSKAKRKRFVTRPPPQTETEADETVYESEDDDNSE